MNLYRRILDALRFRPHYEQGDLEDEYTTAHLQHRHYTTPHHPGDFYTLQDKAYVASWSQRDGEYIAEHTKLFKRGNIGEEVAMKFYSRLDYLAEQVYNDHPVRDGDLAPIEASVRYDKLTSYGLSLFCKMIVGKSTNGITYMGAGDGTTATTDDFQDVLESEQTRASFADYGYVNALNRLIRYQMTFPITTPTFELSEAGLFDNGNANVGPMIARTVFDPAISHTYGNDYVTVSYILTTVSS